MTWNHFKEKLRELFYILQLMKEKSDCIKNICLIEER